MIDTNTLCLILIDMSKPHTFENGRHNFIMSDFDRHVTTYTFENDIHKYIMSDLDRHDLDPSFENDIKKTRIKGK